MVHRSREMKHLLIAIIAVLSALPREQLFTSAEGCPRRYLRRINSRCYYFSVKKMNWFGALNNCLRKGLTLADLSSPRDFYGAIDFLSSKGNMEDFWFGGNDLQTEGRFQYISNGRLVRYYSNYSIVEPTEHSGCDDCLEARIRSNMTVVAADNCLERQYFICSERYCQSASDKKPRHHSHEHLHHFHHDIGEPSEEMEEIASTPSPLDLDSGENLINTSEGDGASEPEIPPEVEAEGAGEGGGKGESESEGGGEGEGEGGGEGKGEGGSEGGSGGGSGGEGEGNGSGSTEVIGTNKHSEPEVEETTIASEDKDETTAATEEEGETTAASGEIGETTAAPEEEGETTAAPEEETEATEENTPTTTKNLDTTAPVGEAPAGTAEESVPPADGAIPPPTEEAAPE